jgi:hypothetical protein
MQPTKHDAGYGAVLVAERPCLETQVAAPAAQGENVAEVIECELFVGAIGHVAGIGRATLIGFQTLGDAADAKAEECVKRAK